MPRKKRAACPPPDSERLLRDLQSPDEAVRGDAVRSLCPCHAGWEAFEGHVGAVLSMLRDGSREVRAHALHVFDDAARMVHDGELEYYLQAAGEMIRRKRASRFRPDEGGAEARRREELKWLGRRRSRT